VKTCAHDDSVADVHDELQQQIFPDPPAGVVESLRHQSQVMVVANEPDKPVSEIFNPQKNKDREDHYDNGNA